MSTTVSINPSVTAEQRNDPRFQQLLDECERGFNDPTNDGFKRLIGLHEAAHAVFARRANARSVRFVGPTMRWDSRHDCPAISRSATAWTSSTESSVIANLKASVAGFIVRRELSAVPNDVTAISTDLQTARDWYDQNVGGTDAEFEAAMQEAERQVVEELKSPKTVAAIQAEARRFVREMFPSQPKTDRVTVGRNDPCPCGSGKKVKNCHLQEKKHV